MQSLVRTGPSAVSNPLMGNTLRYRMVAAPTPAATATRQVTTMAKKKGVRIIVTMECTEARGEGATPSRYTTQKVGRRSGPAALSGVRARAPIVPSRCCRGLQKGPGWRGHTDGCRHAGQRVPRWWHCGLACVASRAAWADWRRCRSASTPAHPCPRAPDAPPL
jgi:large subunit ribosomal protein L33